MNFAIFGGISTFFYFDVSPTLTIFPLVGLSARRSNGNPNPGTDIFVGNIYECFP